LGLDNVRSRCRRKTAMTLEPVCNNESRAWERDQIAAREFVKLPTEVHFAMLSDGVEASAPMKRPQFLKFAVLVAGAGLAAGIAFCLNRAANPLPQLSEIERMEASVYDRESHAWLTVEVRVPLGGSFIPPCSPRGKTTTPKNGNLAPICISGSRTGSPFTSSFSLSEQRR
jgi:hypothetical protein